jgi:hypothetical protein
VISREPSDYRGSAAFWTGGDVPYIDTVVNECMDGWDERTGKICQQSLYIVNLFGPKAMR